MSELTDESNVALVVERLMRNFSKKIGAKDEPLIWGVKSSSEIQSLIARLLPDTVDGKKVSGVKVLTEQPSMQSDKTPVLKSIHKGCVVYIPNADTWNQDVLLRVAFQSSQAGCKALLGFSDPSRLSMGIYQFLVSQQIANTGELSQWALNMATPIGDIR